MDFLEENGISTCIRKWNIVVYEQDKAEAFQDEWDDCFAKKYGGELDSEIEDSWEEASSSEDEAPPPKKQSKAKKQVMM